MSSPSPTYPVSINPSITDKPDGTTRVDLGKGWESGELSEEGFATSVRQGHALAPHYRGGHRKTSNFICAGFLAADVDRGRTLEDAKDHAFVRHHAALIHTTASHTPENNRFRIIFLLDEPILSARDWAAAQLGLALTLESDTSVSDGARLFFGNTLAVFHRIGRTMSPKVMADLIARGKDACAARSPGGGLLPVDSARRIAGPELIKVSGGQLVRMDEMRAGVRVHCPHHDDTDPARLRFALE
jgi:hypothetical protein